MSAVITPPRSLELPRGFAYESGFLASSAADALFATLDQSVRWRAEQIRLFGRAVDVPRKVAWFGDAGLRYRYSGQDHHANGWPGYLRDLRVQVEAYCSASFNFVLLNRYQDGRDAMAWHSDDEPELGPAPCIAALSLGAERVLRVRTKARPAAGRRVSVPLPLAHGSLLVMSGDSQRDFDHCIPRVASCGPRISLTFRCIEPIA